MSKKFTIESIKDFSNTSPHTIRLTDCGTMCCMIASALNISTRKFNSIIRKHNGVVYYSSKGSFRDKYPHSSFVELKDAEACVKELKTLLK